jgi:hypothetical protein
VAALTLFVGADLKDMMGSMCQGSLKTNIPKVRELVQDFK